MGKHAPSGACDLDLPSSDSKGGSMFDKVSSQKLRDVAEVLSGVYAERQEDLRIAQFARTLSVIIRCELARRYQQED